MSEDTFIVLCHEEDRAVWHLASILKRTESEEEKRLYKPLGYGTHTMPEEFWTAGPRRVAGKGQKAA